MPRSDSTRAEGALDEVTVLVPGPKGERIQRLLTEWVNGKGRAAAGRSIKLGGYLHSKEEKETRAQVRAVLLAAQCFGSLDANGQGYKAYAKQIAGDSTAALAKRLTDYYDAHRRFEVINASPNGIGYGPSFNFADAQVRRNCEQAYQQVTKILHAAYQDVGSALNGVTASEKRFTAWFGPAESGRVNLVRNNFFAMLEAIKVHKLYLYYRGPLPADAVGVRDDYSDFGPPLPRTGEDYCGMATRRSKRNLSNPAGDDLHIKLGNGVVLRGSLQPEDGRNTYAGTIVHEISHIVCETRDVKLKQAASGALFSNTKGLTSYTSIKQVPRVDNDGSFVQTYGTKFCQYMAINWPDKAVMNADNYCFFVEQFLA
jgi:hypothetical protein